MQVPSNLPKTISSVGHCDRSHYGNSWDTQLSVHAGSKERDLWSNFYRLLGLIILGSYHVLSRQMLPKYVVYDKNKNKSPKTLNYYSKNWVAFLSSYAYGKSFWYIYCGRSHNKISVHTKLRLLLTCNYLIAL